MSRHAKLAGQVPRLVSRKGKRPSHIVYRGQHRTKLFSFFQSSSLSSITLALIDSHNILPSLRYHDQLIACILTGYEPGALLSFVEDEISVVCTFLFP